MVKILLIDEDRSMRNVVKEMLEYEGYRVDTVQEYKVGLDLAQKESYDIILCDMQTCRPFFDHQHNLVKMGMQIIVASRTPSIEEAVKVMRHGAMDYLAKPIDINRLLKSIKSVIDTDIAELNRSVHRAVHLRTKNKLSPNVDDIVGDSGQINHVKHLIDIVAPSEARVLILGANGTGKELVARWLHEKSPRQKGPFVEVNCAAIPSELIESELFGHEKGAFTSAIKQRKGKFEQADGGTIFLDEIGDMSLSAQAKVLRALQEHRISRVGSDTDITVNARVVAATNKDLRTEIEEGRFREDLYHRLSVIVIRVPALAERLDDVPLLVSHFVGRICNEYNIPKKDVDIQAVRELQNMGWRGNIRELRNVIERLIILSGKQITLEDVKLYAMGI